MADLSTVYEKLSPEPLKDAMIDEFYVDAIAGRGDDPVKTLKRHLLKDPAGKQQILFSGYRGCGKSTELNKMAKEIARDMIVLNYSALSELDPMTISYVELFVITMEKLFDISDKYHFAIRPELLRSVNAWRQSAEIEKIRELTTEAEAELGGEVEPTVPFLAKFFMKMRLSASASYSNKKTIVETIEPRLSGLISHCNDLIREVKLRLADDGMKGLVIIIEDLDKLSVEKAEELFFNHSYVLTSLESNVVFTFPVSLRHHPKAKIIKDNFDQDFELPMVKVHDKQGNPFTAGRDTLKTIIECRIGKDCFAANDLLYQFIDVSGGCLRDLFRLIRDAADNALNQDRSLITEADYLKSFYRLRRDYENTIAEKRIDHQLVVTVEEYFQTLKTVALSETKKVDNTEAALDLRQSLCILGYNDEGWCDVHPVVRSILQERKMI